MVVKDSAVPSSLSERASVVRGTYDQVTRGGRAWGTDGTSRAVRVLRKLLSRVRPKKDSFKTPTFDGTTDVDYFLKQFADVSRANKWSSQEEFMHLRGALQGKATIYGRAATTADIFLALRNQFSIPPAEARRRLLGLERKPQDTFLQHAERIDQLVRLGHDLMTRDHQVLLGVETYISTLKHPELQRHLLAARPSTLLEAVQASRDFEAIDPQVPGPGRSTPKAGVNMLKTCLLKIMSQVVKLAETLSREKNLRQDERFQSRSGERSQPRSFGRSMRSRPRKDERSQSRLVKRSQPRSSNRKEWKSRGGKASGNGGGPLQ
jgi:hypothetical protein